jgi:hypothetical protein
VEIAEDAPAPIGAEEDVAALLFDAREGVVVEVMICILGMKNLV